MQIADTFQELDIPFSAFRQDVTFVLSLIWFAAEILNFHHPIVSNSRYLDGLTGATY